MLYEFITLNREDIIRRCRAKVATRPIPPPTAAEVDHGVPLFLDQLVDALRHGQSSSAEMSRSALLHGHDLLRQGFTVSQVVHDYGDVCQSITELALETNAPVSTEDFRLLNGCLDSAIAGAVTEYGREHNQSTLQSALDGETVRENELRAGDSSGVGRRGFVDVRVGVGIDERRQFDFVARDAFDHVADDRECGNGFQFLRGHRLA